MTWKEISKILVACLAFVAATALLFIGWLFTAINNTLGWDWQGVGTVVLCAGLAVYFIRMGVITIREAL
jgi:hypothetical protein